MGFFGKQWHFTVPYDSKIYCTDQRFCSTYERNTANKIYKGFYLFFFIISTSAFLPLIYTVLEHLPYNYHCLVLMLPGGGFWAILQQNFTDFFVTNAKWQLFLYGF